MKKKNSLISLCNLELAFKSKAKSSALENYRKQKNPKSPAKVEFKLRDKEKDQTNEQKNTSKLNSFSHTNTQLTTNLKLLNQLKSLRN